MFAAADVLAHVKVGLQKVKTLFFVGAVENQQPFGEQLRFAFEAAFEEEEAGPRSIDAQIWFSRVLRFPQKAVCGVTSVEEQVTGDERRTITKSVDFGGSAGFVCVSSRKPEWR